MNRIGKLTALMLGLWAGAAVAATASSNVFKLDFRRVKTAAVTEHIQYSTAWLEGRNLRGVGNKLDGYRRFVVISVGGYTGPSLSWARVLVRISTNISGFDYHDMAYPQTGGDLIFTDYNESVVYDHDIDEWNVNGESLVWVKIPTLTAGLKIKMGYGKSGSSENSNPGATWNGYAGVWHMGANGAVEKDSTANGLNAMPYATGAAFVPRAGGVCGNSQTVGSQVPNYDSLSLGGVFTVSGWFRADAVEKDYAKLFYRNDSGWADGGWGVECKKSSTDLTVVGSSNSTCLGVTIPTLVDQWVYCAFVYNGASVTVYANGTQIAAGTIVSARDNGKALKIARERLTCDEVRLCKGAFSSTQIKFDYDTVNNRNFCTFSPSYYIADNPKAVVKVNRCLKTPPKYLVVDMSGGRSAARWPISYLDEVPNGGWTDEYKTEKLVLRYIPAGSFIMGGRATDYPDAVNTNLHMVTLTKPFYIGVFECTQRQWELAMGNRPSFFTNETCYATRPVEQISYSEIRGQDLGLKWPAVDAVDDGSFLEVIRRKSGLVGLDLPTDAQWEYACRAGSASALNTGVNLSNEMGDYACTEIVDAARFGGNSDYPRMVAEGVDCKGVTDAQCSAKVGSYHPNAWGIYDMHGNLWERCLDRATEIPLGSKDPVGSSDETIVRRMIRGGGYNELAWRCTSGFRYSDINGMGYSAIAHGNTVGFRICLHNATVYPSSDSATILVNASGASAADWTPTEVGTYQLTHEVQMDGVTVGATERALFKVEGPELVIKANGELEPGVEVVAEKVGGGGEWTIYYTIDGSAPTAETTLYEGPFALEESATVRAVAISEAGVRSDEARADFTLHDAMSVVGAVARQRYPWNGMVDIDCEITGDSNRVYAVEVVATDLDGGTNLPVKTVHMAARPESAPYRLAPGKYRFTWNADDDIAGDFDFANVSVSVSAKSGPLVGYARQMTISTDGYAGSETLTNVPVLVRLSTAIVGFDYNDFASPSNGADMVFMDESETQALPYEIDEWHTNGESLVWVKLPELNRETKFKLAYGCMETGNRELGMGNGEECQHEVWREYAGVWHMNEDSGTAFDSTEHGLDALPDHGTNKLADVSQMVAYENGACGRARVNSLNAGVAGNYMKVPSYDALKLGSDFSVSIWVRAEEIQGYPRLVSRKHFCDDIGGWEIAMRQTAISNSVLGAQSATKYADHYLKCPSVVDDWVGFSFVFSQNTVSCYTNGVIGKVLSLDAATDNGECLSFGNTPNAFRERSLHGQYDEIRLRGGTLSAARIKADYDMIANKNFCAYLMVKEGVEE